jgi:nucleoside-diphosphate-sugar epimerase
MVAGEPAGASVSAGRGERFLVTGAMGCIGAWTVRVLVREGVPVTVFDRASDPRRLRLLLSEAELAQVAFVTGDVTDGKALGAALDEHGITNVIHLAALQVPFCRADPVLGAQVNVVGTVVVFEAVRVRSDRIRQVVYAGSVGMFDALDADADTHRLRADAVAHPLTLYGVYKQANEATSRVYWRDHGVSSVGLRPLTVFGPGRDQGMTSGPTKAVVAAVLGRPYRIAFGGSTLYHYAEDVARTFILASRSGLRGAHAFNLGGTRADMAEVVAAIEDAVPDARGLITFADESLPFPDDIDTAGLEQLGAIPVTPLREAIARSVALYRDLERRGALVAAEQGLEG